MEPHIIPQGLLTLTGPDTAVLASFATFIAVILLWTLVCSRTLKRLLGIPIIAGQLIAGFALGPSGFGITRLSFFAKPFSVVDLQTGAKHIFVSSDLFGFFILLLSSSLTAAYLSWLGGRFTNLKDISRNALTVLGTGIIGSVLSIGTVAFVLYLTHMQNFDLTLALSSGLILASTSIAIPAAVLFSKGKMWLPSSKITLGAAAIDDMVTILLLSLFFAAIRAGNLPAPAGIIIPGYGGGGFAGSLISMAFVIVASSLFGYVVMPRLTKFLAQKHRAHLIPAVVFLGIMLAFGISEFANVMTGIVGAYFAGLFHRIGTEEHQAEQALSPFVESVLVPLSFGTVGLQIKLHTLSSWNWIIIGLLLLAALGAKMAASLIATALSNITGLGRIYWRLTDSLLLGSMMGARGEAAITIAIILYSSHLLTHHQYAMAMLTIMLTAIASPILLALNLRLHLAPTGKDGEFHLKLGRFSTIGTSTIFSLIANQIEELDITATPVAFSEGRQVIYLPERDIRMTYHPTKGITLSGNQQQLKHLLKQVREKIIAETEQLSTTNPGN